jgi:hypothetical protein
MGEKPPSPLSSLRFGRLGRNAKHKLLLTRMSPSPLRMRDEGCGDDRARSFGSWPAYVSSPWVVALHSEHYLCF